MEIKPAAEPIETEHIGALDGLRALAVGIVCWYHIWQQSWLMPYIRGPIAELFGKSAISLDFLPRTGYVFVDLMLLLSAFLLFLPYVRAHFNGEPLPDTGLFYFRRGRRILPSYFFAVLVIFFGYSVPAGLFLGFGDGAKELFLNLTLTQVFDASAFLYSRIDCVLWTVCVEAELYLVFPFLARAFLKRPDTVFAALMGLSHLYIYKLVLPAESSIRLLLNTFPAFLGVFANGMLAAWLLVYFSKKCRHSAFLSLGAGAVTVADLIWIVNLLKTQAEAYGDKLQPSQLVLRFPLSCAFALLVFLLPLEAKWVRKALGCRLMRFLAGISYNMYIWHQWLAVHLKAVHIPYWTGEQSPNFTGDLVWQKKYTALCFGIALLMAVLTTYLIEKPGAKLFDRMKERMEKKRAKALANNTGSGAEYAPEKGGTAL